jgi:hypothetical protein
VGEGGWRIEGEAAMSRAFVSEDSGGPDPSFRYPLPARDDPAFPAAAARALIAGADVGDSAGAEEATGYRFGEPLLVPHVLDILQQARAEANDRMEQLAERYLRRAGVAIPDA